MTDMTSEYGARGVATSERVGTRPGLRNGAGVAALINFPSLDATEEASPASTSRCSSPTTSRRG